MRTSEVLSKAADELQARGHTKHQLTNEHGCVCLFGAVNCAMTGNPSQFALTPEGNESPGLVRAREFLQRSLGFGDDGGDQVLAHHRLIRWNNDEERTTEEVVRALRDASQLAAAEELEA